MSAVIHVNFYNLFQRCNNNKKQEVKTNLDTQLSFTTFHSRVYTTSLAKVNVERLHHYTIFLRLAHFGL